MAYFVYKLPTNVDIEKLKAAWQLTVDAFDNLRTRIIESGEGELLQVLLKDEKIEWMASSTVDAVFGRSDHQPTGFGQKLVQFHLVAHPEERVEKHLVIHINHAIYDAYTNSLMLDYVEEAYCARVPPGPTPYSRFIDHVQQISRQAADQFWLTEMDGIHAKHYPTLSSPTEKRQRAQAAIWSDFDYRPSKFTMSSLVQAAWALVLAGNLGSNDVLFGLNLSGRDTDLKGIESIAGPTIMFVPRRVQVYQSETCAELLTRMQVAMAGIIEYGHIGVPSIKQLRNLQNLRLNNILVVNLASTDTNHAIHTSVPSPAEPDFHTAPLVINVVVHSSEQCDKLKIELRADYDLRSLDTRVANRLLHQLDSAIRQMQDTDLLVSQIDICTDEERKTIEKWTASATVTEETETVVSIMAARATATTGVIAKDGSLTWKDIELYSSLLAPELKHKYRCDRGDVVELDLGETKWIVVAAIAVLKAGAAYVIVDSVWTQQKHLTLRGAVCIRAYITCSSSDFGVDKSLVMKINPSNLGTLQYNIDKPDWDPPCSTDAAYISLIDGPRGAIDVVRMDHRSVCGAFYRNRNILGLSEYTRWMQSSFTHSDMAQLGILNTIMAGGCLCLDLAAGAWDPVATEDKLNQDLPTHVFLPSAALPMFDPRMFSGKRVVVYGPPLSLSARWGESNILTIYSARISPMQFSAVQRTSETLWKKLLPVGGLEARIFETDHTPRSAVIGAVGELYVKVSDAISSQIPSRLRRDLFQCPQHGTFQRTGNLVKYDEDGALIWVSHKSTRNIINGQRVEVEEVEDFVRSTFDASDDIGVAAEIVTFSKEFDGQIVLFFAPRVDRECIGMDEDHGSHISLLLEERAATLRMKFSQQFPAFMMPKRYMVLQSLPLTIYGTIDRDTLARLASRTPAAEVKSFDTRLGMQGVPRSSMEMMLRQMWSKVLRLEESSIYASDVFISLGGDSISAMRLVAIARSRHIALSVVDVLTSANLADLSNKATMIAQQPHGEILTKGMHLAMEQRALRVRDLVKDRALRGRVKRQVSPSLSAIEDVTVCHDYQAGAVLSGLTARRGWSNYLIVDYQEPIDRASVEQACKMLIAQNPILRTVFFPHKQTLLQIVYREVDLHMRHFINIEDVAQATKLWTEKDKLLPSTLLKRTIRAASFESVDGRLRIALGFTHAFWDGISLTYLCEDLFAACQKRPLLQRPSFTDYAHFTASDNRPMDTAYWQHLLRGSRMTEVAEHAGPSYTNPLNTTLEQHIPVPAGLGTYGFTFATILKAAWAIILARWSSSSDVTFGHLVSGRAVGFPDVDLVTGPCLSLVPVRLGVDERLAVREFLKQVQEQHIASTPHEHVGLERIVRRATDWPRWTRCSTMVQHQNHVSGDTDVTKGYTTSLICPQHDSADILIISSPLNGEMMSVTLSFCNEIINPASMQTALDQFCKIIERLILALAKSESSLRDIADMRVIDSLPRLPLFRTNDRQCGHAMPSNSQPPDDTCEKIARSIWERLDLPADGDVDTAFFDTSGNVVPAVQLVEILRDEHRLEVTIEDIMKVPTIRGLAQTLQQMQ